MTSHDSLVDIAARWLSTAQRCAVVVAELRCASTYEQPDAIGWTMGDESVLVECKASRSDFLRDRHKVHRQTGPGMGRRRFYMAPVGVIGPDELVGTDWGLVHVADGKARVKVQAPRRREYDANSERRLLIKATCHVTNYSGEAIRQLTPPVGAELERGAGKEKL